MARRPRPDDVTSDGTPANPIAHVLDLARETIPPIHRAGIPFVAGPAAVALLGRRHRWIARPALLAAGACAAFFRHPSRVPPTAGREVHQPSPNCWLRPMGSSAQIAAAGAGTPTKKSRV